MRTRFSGRNGVLAAFIVGLVIASAATAGAARLITGKQVKDGTISEKDLSKAVRKQLARAGVTGPKGDQGLKGDKGDSGQNGSPDTEAEVLSKLEAVDGSGSQLDADTLDGVDSSGFLGATGKAADADRLDGVDSTSFVQGKRYFASGADVDVSRTLPSFGYYYLFCQSGAATMQFQNTSGGSVTLFRERASTSEVAVSTVSNGGAPPLFINASNPVTDHFTVRVASAARSVTWDAWVKADGSTCTLDLLELDQK